METGKALSDKNLKYRELRADWLKLRGYLHDPNTQLPSLPTVIDGVRRRLEDGDLIGTMVHLSDRINARTIAEGSETLEEFETVRSLGVDYAQGYFFAGPRLPREGAEIHYPRPTGTTLNGGSQPIRI